MYYTKTMGVRPSRPARSSPTVRQGAPGVPTVRQGDIPGVPTVRQGDVPGVAPPSAPPPRTQSKLVQDARARENNPTSAEIELSNRPDVQSTATARAADLARLGLKGALGVAALMILTGKSNPGDAINEALKAARETAKTAADAGGGFLKVIAQVTAFFKKYGLYISLSSSCLVFLMLLLPLLPKGKK